MGCEAQSSEALIVPVIHMIVLKDDHGATGFTASQATHLVTSAASNESRDNSRLPLLRRRT